MNDTLQILDSITAIQEASDVAYDNVHEKINAFAEKVSVMEQCGLNVMSENPTIQYIIENHDEVITEYKNDGPKKINKKLISWVNYALPNFKLIKKHMDDGTITHQIVDVFGSLLGEGSISINRVLSTIKTAKKTDEFGSDEIKLLDKCSDTLTKWKAISKTDRKDQSGFDRWFTGLDTRTMDKIKGITGDVVDVLEEVLTMARKHYDGGDTE